MTPTSIRKAALWLLWIGFIVYILTLAPPVQSDTFWPVRSLLSGQFPLVNPVMVSLFSMVGIWLLIYSAVIFADGRMQRWSAWKFMLASIGSGVIGLIPYLALRDPAPQFFGAKDRWLRLMDARSTGWILALSTLGLGLFAVLLGDWGAFWQEWHTNKFIHGMGLAFCLFALLFPTLLGDDMARRGLQNRGLFWAVALLPLIGPLLYLCLRPSLRETGSQVNSQQPQKVASPL